jgi:stearoyl-CoA desaturase (delta-9 desaturase)
MKNIFSSSTKGAQIVLLFFLAGTLSSLFFYNFNLESVFLIILGYFLYGCLGIVLTFHRLLTHNSYSTYPLISKIFSLLGCLGGTGSPMAWVAIHINHHLKSDKPSDPHSPLYKGLRIFLLNYEEEIDTKTKWRMRKLITNKYQQFLHRYYFLIIFGWSTLLYLLGGFYLVICLHWAPALLTALMSNIVNYVGHKPNWIGGYRSFNLTDQSTNNWVWAIPSWGESWHNNHHRYPKNYYFGKAWYEIDISGLIIKLIKIN